jgi:hypothetical protein
MPSEDAMRVALPDEPPNMNEAERLTQCSSVTSYFLLEVNWRSTYSVFLKQRQRPESPPRDGGGSPDQLPSSESLSISRHI